MGFELDFDEIVIGYKNQPFYELAPTAFCTFSASGKKWRTLIHYWTAMFFKDDFMQDWIRNQDTPQMAMSCASKKGFIDFHQIEPSLILYGLQEKFNQNDNVRLVLLSTGSITIRYAGSKGFLSENNRYGRLLMRVREIYQD